MINSIINSIRGQVAGLIRIGLPVPKYVLIHADYEISLIKKNEMMFGRWDKQMGPLEIQGLKIIFTDTIEPSEVHVVPVFPAHSVPNFVKHEENPRWQNQIEGSWKNEPYRESPGPTSNLTYKSKMNDIQE